MGHDSAPGLKMTAAARQCRKTAVMERHGRPIHVGHTREGLREKRSCKEWHQRLYWKARCTPERPHCCTAILGQAMYGHTNECRSTTTLPANDKNSSGQVEQHLRWPRGTNRTHVQQRTGWRSNPDGREAWGAMALPTTRAFTAPSRRTPTLAELCTLTPQRARAAPAPTPLGGARMYSIQRQYSKKA